MCKPLAAHPFSHVAGMLFSDSSSQVADLAAVETHLSRPLLKDVADTVVETAAHRGLIDQVGEDLMQMIEDTVEVSSWRLVCSFVRTRGG